MKVIIEKQEYEVVIERKRQNQNTYLRVRSDGTIYITTSIFSTEKQIRRIIEENNSSIEKMLERQEKKQASNDGFWYLGKHFDIIYTNDKTISLGEAKAFLPKNFDIDKFYLQKATILFQERLDYWYDHFLEKIPRPTLRIRKMKSRWGVCNTKSKTITLNLLLMKRDPLYLDYVIIHEMSHLVYPNHQASFWLLVERHIPTYKTIRKQMKDF